MKVAFIHEHSHNFVGQERSLMERLIGLRDLGIQCEVLLPEKGYFRDLLIKQGFQVRFYSLRHLTKKNPFPYLKTIVEISRLIKTHKYSIIHCSGVYPNQYALPAARLRGVSCLVHVNSTIYTKEFFNNCFIKFADYIIAVSEGVRQKILQETSISNDKIKTIYDSVGNKRISEYLNSGQRLRNKFHISAKTKIVGQIGSLIPLKGYEYFIEMAKIVKEAYPDIKFFIVGPAPDEAYEQLLREKIAQLNLRDDIILTGFQENVYPFIDMFDISVLASTVEGLGRVIIESQKMGKPIIGTNIPGIDEAIIDHKTGLLVPPRDPRALADAVLELLNNPSKAKKLSLEGQKITFEKFDEKKHAQLIREVYQGLRRKPSSK